MKGFFVFIFLILSGFANAEAQTFRQLSILHQSIEPLYRKPSRKELIAVAPKPELFEKHAEFLRGRNTGLIKLIGDSGCADNTKIVVATEECLKYTMPGAGSSYSFRTGNYRIPRLSDILFTENSFQASGVLLHGVFVNVGNVSLDKLDLQTKGLKFLIDFQPEPDYEKAKVIADKLVKGIEQDGFLYRRGLYAKENTTFVLRSIAYAGKYFRSVSSVTYNEFAFDERRDIIVAFRIVDKDSAGNVTILWKILADEKSPRVKRPKDEKYN